MKVFLSIPIALLLVSCATNQVTTQDAGAWASFAYEGFGNKIERLAGANAVMSLSAARAWI